MQWLAFLAFHLRGVGLTPGPGDLCLSIFPLQYLYLIDPFYWRSFLKTFLNPVIIFSSKCPHLFPLHAKSIQHIIHHPLNHSINYTIYSLCKLLPISLFMGTEALATFNITCFNEGNIIPFFTSSLPHHSPSGTCHQHLQCLPFLSKCFYNFSPLLLFTVLTHATLRSSALLIIVFPSKNEDLSIQPFCCPPT